MNTIVIGTSHITTLRNALKNAGVEFGSVEFLTSSYWSIAALGTTIEGGRISLREDPLRFLERLTPQASLEAQSAGGADAIFYRRRDGKCNIVPTNVRNFYIPDKRDTYPFEGQDVDIVIAIFYTSPRTDARWIQQFSDADPNLPISVSVAGNIPELGGRAIPKPLLLWGPHVFDGELVEAVYEDFSLIETLKQLRALYPTAVKVLCVPPPNFAPLAELPPLMTAEAYERSLDVYAQILRKLYGVLDFRICMFPPECLDESGVYTSLDYSLRPQIRDAHMNEAFGNLLWRDIRKLVSNQ